MFLQIIDQASRCRQRSDYLTVTETIRAAFKKTLQLIESVALWTELLLDLHVCKCSAIMRMKCLYA